MDRAQRRIVLTDKAVALKAQGKSNAEIANELSLDESTVRVLLLDRKLNG
jgi:DNA-binding CsgD family transcriptional regulator